MSSNLPPGDPLTKHSGSEAALTGTGISPTRLTPEGRDALALAVHVQRQLLRTAQTLVLAESCTAGLIAATLGRIPGISSVLAGSLVVYQSVTKAAWLGISQSLLEDPGPVSREVAEEMASRALGLTPHASVALSITGHLGPDAPQQLDGIAWCAVAFRGAAVRATRLQLCSETPGPGLPAGEISTAQAVLVRRRRQDDAAHQALQFLLGELARLE